MVDALLRRVDMDKSGGAVLTANGLQLDAAAQLVKYNNRPVEDLTRREFELLLALVRNSPRILSRQEILEKVWRTVSVENLVDTHLHNLRNKLPRNYPKGSRPLRARVSGTWIKADLSSFPFIRYFFGIHGFPPYIISKAVTIMKLNGFLNFIVCRAAGALVLLPGGALPPLPAGAMIASSGEYQLESSVRDNGGGEVLSGGAYASKGSAGQSAIPAGRGNSAAGTYINRSGFYNPPHFTFQKGLASVINFNPGSASLTLPPGAVDKEMFDITLNNDPGAQPLNIDPGLINSANSKIERNEGAWSRLFSDNITEISLFDEQDVWNRPLLKSGALAMRYADGNSDGILDGSNPPVRIDTIRAWALDEDLAMWAKLPGSYLDRTSKMITVPFMSPGVYALLGMVDESVKDVYAFPVPFRPNGPQAGTGSGQSGTDGGGITFMNIPQAGEIEIYTLDGRLVRKLPIPAGLTIPRLNWDVRTAGGGRAASGVYLWRAVSGSNSKTGKLMVIW